jgi:hypothetical protein
MSTTTETLDSCAGKFAKLTYRVYLPATNQEREVVKYGFVCWWEIARAAKLAMFCRTPDDNLRVFSDYILPIDVINIEPMSEKEYMDVLCSYSHVVVRHFGWRYRGRIIDTARTRVLVSFRARGGKLYERWKPVYAVQPDF